MENVTQLVFEHIWEEHTAIVRTTAHRAWERLPLAAIALSKLGDAFDWGHHAARARTQAPWVVLTFGAVAAHPDPAACFREEGSEPARAAVLGERVARAMRRSRWGVGDDELALPIAFVSVQGVPVAEARTLATLAVLALDAAESLRGAVSDGEMVVSCLTKDTVEAGEAYRGRRWAGLLAARLDRPDLLEIETRHLLVDTCAALIDEHEDVADWIPRDRDPSVRIRAPENHPGVPLIVTPFVLTSERAWRAVDSGAIVDRAFAKTAPGMHALLSAPARGARRVH